MGLGVAKMLGTVPCCRPHKGSEKKKTESADVHRNFYGIFQSNFADMKMIQRSITSQECDWCGHKSSDYGPRVGRNSDNIDAASGR